MKHSSGFSELFKSASPVFAVIGILCALLAAGCGRSADRAENLFQIPWPDESGKYSLQAVSISSFDQLHTLQGRYVQVFVNPYARDGQIVSQMPIGRFIRSKEGVHIPADYTSLQATAIHAHFERFHRMNQALGVELEWPVKVGIRSKVNDRWGMVRNNAIYDGRLDALLLVPFISKKNLPIALNGGILAHEHFHMIFQDNVLRRIRFKRKERLGLSVKACAWGARGAERESDNKAMEVQDDPSLYPSLFNEFNVRSLNEGLADFWGWVYTGDVDFIRHSLPSESPYRRLDVKVKNMVSREWVMRMVFNHVSQKPFSESVLGENVYQLGSTYARLLRELTVEMTEDSGQSFESRMKIAQVIVKAMPTMARGVMKAETSDSYLSPNLFLKALYDNWPTQDEAVCKYFKRIMAADEDSFTDELKCEGGEAG